MTSKGKVNLVGPARGELMQIGVVAERVGLSLRTIRYYEEVGLVTPAERSAGGFRLYDESALDRLRLIKQMKPLEFSLEQMRDLLDTVEELTEATATATATGAEADTARRNQLVERLSMFHAIVEARVETLREQLHRTEDFAHYLRDRVEPAWATTKTPARRPAR